MKSVIGKAKHRFQKSVPFYCTITIKGVKNFQAVSLSRSKGDYDYFTVACSRGTKRWETERSKRYGDKISWGAEESACNGTIGFDVHLYAGYTDDVFDTKPFELLLNAFPSTTGKEKKQIASFIIDLADFANTDYETGMKYDLLPETSSSTGHSALKLTVTIDLQQSLERKRASSGLRLPRSISKVENSPKKKRSLGNQESGRPSSPTASDRFSERKKGEESRKTRRSSTLLPSTSSKGAIVDDDAMLPDLVIPAGEELKEKCEAKSEETRRRVSHGTRSLATSPEETRRTAAEEFLHESLITSMAPIEANGAERPAKIVDDNAVVGRPFMYSSITNKAQQEQRLAAAASSDQSLLRWGAAASPVEYSVAEPIRSYTEDETILMVPQGASGGNAADDEFQQIEGRNKDILDCYASTGMNDEDAQLRRKWRNSDTWKIPQESCEEREPEKKGISRVREVVRLDTTKKAVRHEDDVDFDYNSVSYEDKVDKDRWTRRASWNLVPIGDSAPESGSFTARVRSKTTGGNVTLKARMPNKNDGGGWGVSALHRRFTTEQISSDDVSFRIDSADMYAVAVTLKKISFRNGEEPRSAYVMASIRGETTKYKSPLVFEDNGYSFEDWTITFYKANKMDKMDIVLELFLNGFFQDTKIAHGVVKYPMRKEHVDDGFFEDKNLFSMTTNQPVHVSILTVVAQTAS